MKNKIFTFLLALILAFSCVILPSCGDEPGNTDGSVTYKIGLCNYVDDASLNQIVENIEARLEQIGNEKNVHFEILYENCNADSLVLSQIVTNFQTKHVDLMVGVATPVAMRMQAATEDDETPVVFAAVSDPIGTGLVQSLTTPGSNLTGTSDYLNTDAIMNLILALNPETDLVGLLYDNGQDSSTAAIREAKAFLDAKGIRYIEKTGNTLEQVSQAAASLISADVDAVFTPTDNTIMKCELSIYEMFQEAGIPHFGGADSFALNGALLGFGVDYIQLGQQTAEMIAEILLENKDVSVLPVRTFDNGTATINTDVVSALGYDLETLKTAFAPFCTKIQTIRTAEDFQ